MKDSENILALIRENKNIPIDKIENVTVTGDGNCLYRCMSCYLYETEEKFNEIRMKIYSEAKSNKDNIKQFFLENNTDDIIVNTKINTYIEKIKENKFYGGIIEISIFINLYKVNVSLYKLENVFDKYYTNFTNIWS